MNQNNYLKYYDNFLTYFQKHNIKINCLSFRTAWYGLGVFLKPLL